jgi:serine/threonine protein kinase/Tol biopolymer transport system component
VTDPTNRLSTALADRYVIERELGAGGMATVYLAHDVKHDRKVALKVLRPELSAILGAERFLAEIKTTANLQHPHILGLHDSGEADGLVFYVMPYVEGESLRDRLVREKQLPVDEAVRIAREVLGALDYAHRHGVVHRDIKPENILLHDGSALVADFGIALAVSRSDGGTRMTETGMSLGTPHYMSPEQAMGDREITAKSDVYALGCVLYEMLTGEPPFVGPTAQAIVARVLTEEPRSLTVQRRTIPPHVEAAVRKALAKLPADRFGSAAEFAAALADTAFATTATAVPSASSPNGRRWRWVAGALGVALVAVGVVAVLGWMRGTPPGVVRRFNITMDQYQTAFGNPVISPDGTRILYSNFEGALMTRASDDLTAKLIPGSDGAWVPVFSPDSRTIAFNTGFPGAVKVLPLGGGTVRTLVPDSTYGTGLAWSDDGWIYFLHGEDYGRDLMRIRASGGPAEFIARPDSATGALFFYWPQVLPGGRKVLLTVYPMSGDPNIGVLDVSSGKLTTIATGVSARYAPTGHLVVVQGDGSVIAARFDASSGTVRGGFTTVANGLYVPIATIGALTLSDEGTFVAALAAPGGHVVRVSRDGREEVVDPQWEGEFFSVAISPDGSQLAISVTRSGRYELWVKTLGSGAFTRLSSGGTQNYRPSWSPDGRMVVFTSDQRGQITTWQVPADGSGPPTRLLPGVRQSVDEAEYSHDGRWILYRGGSGGGRDIFAMRTGIDSSARAIVATGAEEFSPTLSPDGRWLAYASDASGRTEVYVRPFPNAGTARYTVSHNGGSEPRWSHSGRELFFRDGAENLIAAEVMPGDAFRIGSERTLFSTHAYGNDNRHNFYAVSPDDRSFYFVKSPNVSSTANQLIITLNWFEELRRKVGE